MNNELILNTSKYILILTLTCFIYSEGTSENESINVDINDLFYYSDSLYISKIKNEFNHSIIIDENFNLDDLEIKGVDSITFGEYEDFLNKYYEDNFNDINSRFIRQIEFNPTLILGNSMPHLWPNLSNKYSSGLYIGIALELYRYDLDKKKIVLDGELYLTTMSSKISLYENFQMYNVLCNVSIDLSKKFKLKIGIGQSPTTQGIFNTIKGSLIYKLPINSFDLYLGSYGQFTTGVPYTINNENKRSAFFGFNLIFKPSSIIINY